MLWRDHSIPDCFCKGREGIGQGTTGDRSGIGRADAIIDSGREGIDHPHMPD
jgi:hypothetical protein